MSHYCCCRFLFCTVALGILLLPGCSRKPSKSNPPANNRSNKDESSGSSSTEADPQQISQRTPRMIPELVGRWKGQSPDGNGVIAFEFFEDGSVIWSLDSGSNGTSSLNASCIVDNASELYRLTLFDFQQSPYQQAEFRAIAKLSSKSLLRIEGTLIDHTNLSKHTFPNEFSSASSQLILQSDQK